MHKLLIIGALSERKNLPFVNSLLQKFSEDQIKNGISALNSLRKTGRIKGNEYGIPLPPPPPPPPPPKKPSPKKSTPKKPSPKKPSPKKPSPRSLSRKSNNTVFYTPDTTSKNNTMTALSTIKKLLKSQKANEILKINLLIVGKKVKQLKYSRT
jgi:outer membrane biosynthesis protein TonB